ncbi:MAG: ABC transporter permease [Anaerolineales bacterium]
MRLLSVFRVALWEQLRSPWDLVLTLLLAPMFIWLYWSMMGGGSTYYKVLVMDNDRGNCPVGDLAQTCAEQAIEQMAALTYESGTPLLKLTDVYDRAEAEALLRDRKAFALLIFSENFTDSIRNGEPGVGPQVTFVGDLTNPYYTPAVVFSNAALESYVKEAIGQPSPIQVTEEALGGSASRSEFEIYVPGLLIAASTMMLFSIAILIARQVEAGTVRRLQITRMTALDMLGGISILYVLVSLVTVALSFITAQVLGFRSQGPLWVGMLICVITGVSVVGIGLITACFSRTVARAAIIVNFPLFLVLFFSGAVFPVGNPRLFSLAGRDYGVFDLLPQTHATNALNKVLSLGANLGDVTFELTALTLLTLLYFLVGIWLFRKMYLQAR